ncbi:hypothetical protein BZZ01_00615 [Nostocales cyanobacterium HT-58-2]|nr:hypothetical protein BZZ01_00615 [Nostocales cyanobacterium HT-58-2]
MEKAVCFHTKLFLINFTDTECPALKALSHGKESLFWKSYADGDVKRCYNDSCYIYQKFGSKTPSL